MTVLILDRDKTSRAALRPTQPPVQSVMGVLSLGVERLGHEATHLHVLRLGMS